MNSDYEGIDEKDPDPKAFKDGDSVDNGTPIDGFYTACFFRGLVPGKPGQCFVEWKGWPEYDYKKDPRPVSCLFPPDGKRIRLARAWVSLTNSTPHWPCVVWICSAFDSGAMAFMKLEKRVFIKPMGSRKAPLVPYHHGVWHDVTRIEPFLGYYHDARVEAGRNHKNPTVAANFCEALEAISVPGLRIDQRDVVDYFFRFQGSFDEGDGKMQTEPPGKAQVSKPQVKAKVKEPEQDKEGSSVKAPSTKGQKRSRNDGVDFDVPVDLSEKKIRRPPRSTAGKRRQDVPLPTSSKRAKAPKKTIKASKAAKVVKNPTGPRKVGKSVKGGSSTPPPPSQARTPPSQASLERMAISTISSFFAKVQCGGLVGLPRAAAKGETLGGRRDPSELFAMPNLLRHATFRISNLTESPSGAQTKSVLIKPAISTIGIGSSSSSGSGSKVKSTKTTSARKQQAPKRHLDVAGMKDTKLNL